MSACISQYLYTATIIGCSGGRGADAKYYSLISHRILSTHAPVSGNISISVPVLFTGILIGCFHELSALPCLDHIAHRTLCTDKHVDSELLE